MMVVEGVLMVVEKVLQMDDDLNSVQQNHSWNQVHPYLTLLDDNMIIYDDIYEIEKMILEVCHDILDQYLLLYYVQVDIHDDDILDELIPR